MSVSVRPDVDWQDLILRGLRSARTVGICRCEASSLYRNQQRETVFVNSPDYELLLTGLRAAWRIASPPADRED
jgi:hypothetical protein